MFLCFLGYMNILLWARPCISFAFPVMVLGYVEMKVALDWCCSLLQNGGPLLPLLISSHTLPRPYMCPHLEIELFLTAVQCRWRRLLKSKSLIRVKNICNYCIFLRLGNEVQILFFHKLSQLYIFLDTNIRIEPISVNQI